MFLAAGLSCRRNGPCGCVTGPRRKLRRRNRRSAQWPLAFGMVGLTATFPFRFWLLRCRLGMRMLPRRRKRRVPRRLLPTRDLGLQLSDFRFQPGELRPKMTHHRMQQRLKLWRQGRQLFVRDR